MKYNSFKKLAGTLWRPNYERAGLGEAFSPVFYKIIGVPEAPDYNTILRFLHIKCDSNPGSQFFANEIKVSANFDMLTYVVSELNHMDLDNLEFADIQVFDSTEVNSRFLKTLNTVVNMYELANPFKNKSVKVDFISKMIMWVAEYLRPVESHIGDSPCPKIIYYGNISKHEAYFLLLCHFLIMDVIYINPLKDDMRYLDMDFIDKIESQEISPIGDIMEKINAGRNINIEMSSTAQLMDEIQQEMFTGTGVYRPWQLKDHSIKPIRRKYTLYDFQSNIGEPAKVREGFDVVGNVVNIPNLFFQINGLSSDISEYKKLISEFISQDFTEFSLGETRTYISRELSQDELYQLVFCKSSPTHYEVEELRKLPFYSWKNYNSNVERKLVEALNRLLSDGIFLTPLSRLKEYTVVGNILSISDSIISLLENYDYSEKIPKVGVFLEYDDQLSFSFIAQLCFIYELGFDVVIFDPIGLRGMMNNDINQDMISNIRLDGKTQAVEYKSLKIKSKKDKKKFFGLF